MKKSLSVILDKLRSYKRCESNVTHTSVRTRLYNLKLKPKEKLFEFNEKFDATIREYENCVDAVPLTEQEKRAAYYQAVVGTILELRSVEVMRRQTSTEMSLDEMRSFLSQLEAERKGEQKDKPRVQRVRSASVQYQQQRQEEDRCYRCNEKGHRQLECKFNGTKFYYCYPCKEITEYKSNQCHSQAAKDYRRGHQSNNKSNSYRGNNSNFRGNGRNLKNKDSKENKQVYNRIITRGGRGGRVSKHKVDNRFKKSYTARAASQDEPAESEEENRGKLNNINKSKKSQVTFIADSGATEHIVKKSLILRDFKKSSKEVIRCANKNKQANIKIDGKGNLFLYSNNLKNKVVKLVNVIAAKDVSENLLSLRKFVDAGINIFLNNEVLEIIDRETEEVIVKGESENPNWKVSLVVQSEKEDEIEYDQYICIANLINLEEDEKLKDTKNRQDTISMVGREKEKVKTTTEKEKVSEIQSANSKRKSSKEVNFEEDLNIAKEEKNKEENNKEGGKENQGMLWHRRLGHPSLEYLRKLKQREVKLKDVKFGDDILDCEVCRLAKMDKLPFKGPRERATKQLEIIHTDIMGPVKPSSYPGRYKFIITFTDDYSRMTKAYAIKTKAEAGDYLEKFLRTSRNEIREDKKVCYIRCDNAPEFLGGKFRSIVDAEKADYNLSPAYTPELNGVAERVNRTLQNKTRALLIDSGLPRTMWHLALDVAVYVHNRTPHKNLEFETPLKIFAPKVNNHLEEMKRFSCIMYMKDLTEKGKFANQAIKTILVGFSETAYIVWNLSERKFITTRHARPNEKRLYKDMIEMKSLEDKKIENKEKIPEHKETEEKDEKSEICEIPEEIEKQVEKVTTFKGFSKDENKVFDERIKRLEELLKENKTGNTTKTKESNEEKLKRSSRTRKLVNDSSFQYYQARVINLEKLDFRSQDEKIQNCEEDEIKHMLFATLNRDPINYEEAMKTAERGQWKQSVTEEYSSMDENQVWILVERPKFMKNGERANIIDSKWVFKTKIEKDGTIRRRARLVIRGFKDRNIYNLKETYAPVPRLPLVRAVLAIINYYDLEAYQLDVKTAFLNGELEEEIYMEIPDGYECDEKTKSTKVFKLQKALYGLKISPKKWNNKFTKEVEDLGLQNDIDEPCLFTWRKNGKFVILILYVDDIIITGNDKQKLDECKTKLKEKFKMTDLGEPKKFLGMIIQRNREKKEMIIHQQPYIESVLEKFNMSECKAQSTPMVTRQVATRELKRLDTSENLESK